MPFLTRLVQFSERWSLFWKLHDPDDVFSYNTIKFVTIRDRYLGMLHHAFQLGIIIYIIGIVIIFQKQFLRREVPDGLVRLAFLNGPAGGVDSVAVTKCSSTYPATDGLPYCTFPTQDEIVTGGGSDIIHIASYYTATNIYKTCTTPATCVDTQQASDSYIVANLNQFNLSLDHSFQTASGVTLGHYTPEGFLRARKGGKVATYKQELIKFHSLSADVIPITEVLAATQAHGKPFDLDAIANSYLEGSPGYTGPETYRQFGIVILLVVQYSNVAHYYGGCRRNKDPCFEYDYHVAAIPSIEDYAQETVYSVYPYNRTLLEKRGIRITAILAGEIGSFDFQVLLVQLTTSLALIKVATLIVDQIACRFLPRKAAYKEAKYERTEDFSDKFSKKKSDTKSLEMDGLGGISNKE